MRRGLLLVLGGFVVLAGCTANPMAHESDVPIVASVLPSDGATGVSRAASVVIRFNHSMMRGMEEFVRVYEDGQAQPVPGRWTWSDGYRTLTFNASAMLNPGVHTVRIGRSAATGAVMCEAHAEHHAAGGQHPMHSGAHGGMMGMGATMMKGPMMTGMPHNSCEAATTFTTE
jgi:hypothetical protein